MSDTITISRLELKTRVGVPDAERRRPQKVHISLGLRLRSTKSAALTDDLATTVDYAAVCERVKAVAAERPRKLIETLAEDIARSVLVDFPDVREITVEVEKFILPDTRAVGVKIKRKLSAKEKNRLRAGPGENPPLSGETL